MVTVDAKSSAEAGVILRFQDADNYVVAFYSPQFKGIAIHDRRNGKWGKSLGMIKTPEIGADIRLTAAVTGEHAALLISDGKKSWRTPAVKVSNTKPGKSGLWFYQIGEQQSFDNFKVSATSFTLKSAKKTGTASLVDYRAPDLPSPQDWILVMERADKPEKNVR